MIKKVKWAIVNPNGTFSSSKETVYDSEVGIVKYATILSPFKLGIPNGKGGYATGEAALALLEPSFGSTLPILTPAVSETILVTDAQYPWIDFDKNDPSTYPDHNPDVYNPERYWEGEIGEGVFVQGNIMSYEHADIWGLIGITRYRIFKYDVNQPLEIPNPDYDDVEQTRATEKELYISILKQAFDLLATFTFPLLPLVPNVKWWEDGKLIPVSESHPLAMPTTSGYKKILKPFAGSDDSKQWDAYFAISCEIDDVQLKVRKLLGL